MSNFVIVLFALSVRSMIGAVTVTVTMSMSRRVFGLAVCVGIGPVSMTVVVGV